MQQQGDAVTSIKSLRPTGTNINGRNAIQARLVRHIKPMSTMSCSQQMNVSPYVLKGYSVPGMLKSLSLAHIPLQWYSTLLIQSHD